MLARYYETQTSQRGEWITCVCVKELSKFVLSTLLMPNGHPRMLGREAYTGVTLPCHHQYDAASRWAAMPALLAAAKKLVGGTDLGTVLNPQLA